MRGGRGGGVGRKKLVVLLSAVALLVVWATHTLLVAHSIPGRDNGSGAKHHRPAAKKNGHKLDARLPVKAGGLKQHTDHPMKADLHSDETQKTKGTHKAPPDRASAKKRKQSAVPDTTAPHASAAHQRPMSGDDTVPYWEVTASADVAYLIIISNEDFLDGALVLGASLRLNCPRLNAHTADMAIIITQGRVSRTSKERLRDEGGFNKIFEVPSLAQRAPGAYWKDTFDKIYMFNLTMYKKIVFMDADMINVRSMDMLFDKDFGDPTFVGAIGFRGGTEGPYFQTGMMVIQPTRKMFDAIFEKFESGVPPRGQTYNHGMNGRDGVLLRDVFGNRFKILDNKYSRNLNPRYPVPEYVNSLHLRGKVKPWFDRRLPNSDPELGKKEFGHPYALFWELYEREIHYKSNLYRLATDGKALPEPYGGRFAAPEVSPLTHVWMMRYSTREYVQLLSEEDRRRRDLTLPGLSYHAGRMGASCVEVCAERQLNCSHEALYFSGPQNCTVLRAAFDGNCTRCELGVYWRPHPGSDYPALDITKKEAICKYNLLMDERGRPNCTARFETSRRYCPCVPYADHAQA